MNPIEQSRFVTAVKRLLTELKQRQEDERPDLLGYQDTLILGKLTGELTFDNVEASFPKYRDILATLGEMPDQPMNEDLISLGLIGIHLGDMKTGLHELMLHGNTKQTRSFDASARSLQAVLMSRSDLVAHKTNTLACEMSR